MKLMHWLLMAGLIWTFSCAGDGTTVLDVCLEPSELDASVPDVSETDDGAAEIQEDIVDISTEPDLGPVDAGSGDCEAGSGCFGELCENNEDCDSGICIQHMGDNICSRLCVDKCPNGWQCRAIETGGADVSFACMSDFSVLCQPCFSKADCSTADQQNSCMQYGSNGSYCGASCETGICPDGFVCEQGYSVTGSLSWQCVAQSGECGCSNTAIELGLATACEITNEFGTCDGQRVCSEAGLGDCDALTPMAEICNGVDDDCDGIIDDIACDDGDQCTLDVCTLDGCIHTVQEDTACTDGDPCTYSDKCSDGVCQGTLLECDDGNICTDDVCHEVLGCQFITNSAPCNDDDNCTVADTCLDGACGGGTPVSCNDENPCTDDDCDGVGGCVFSPNEADCDDTNPCTADDICAGGGCLGTSPTHCDDGELCTSGTCGPTTGCLFENNSVPCNDGDTCTQGDACAEGACTGGDPLQCDDGNPCTDNDCAGETGCIFVPNAEVCDDLNDCTIDDQCSEGLCTGTGSLACDDGNPCTHDSCEPDGGCSHEIANVACTDEDICTTNDVCFNGACESGGPLNCDDGNPCTDDTCDPATGCVHTPNDAATCDDGNACTSGDTCNAGICIGAGLVDCNDGSDCTVDSCDVLAGCVNEVIVPCCGNGLVDGEEPCDASDEGCTLDCEVLEGYLCDAPEDCVSNACNVGLGGTLGYCTANIFACADPTGGVPAVSVPTGGVACVTNAESTCDDGTWSPVESCMEAHCTDYTNYGQQDCIVDQGCTPAEAVITSCVPFSCGESDCHTSCVTDVECAPGYSCEDSSCTLTINTAGSIKVGSEYPANPITGYAQCAGFRNTADWDITTTDWLHSCAGDGVKNWIVQVIDTTTGGVLLNDTFPSYTAYELLNNLNVPGEPIQCNTNGQGECGKLSVNGTGRALLVFNPTNGNAGCNGDDNSSGALRIATSTLGQQLGNNYLFVGGIRHDGAFRGHLVGEQPDSEIRLGAPIWNGCSDDGRGPQAVVIYLEQ